MAIVYLFFPSKIHSPKPSNHLLVKENLLDRPTQILEGEGTVFQKSRKMTKNHRECIFENFDEILFK